MAFLTVWNPLQITKRRKGIFCERAEVRTLSGGECLDEFNIEEAECGELSNLIRDPSGDLGHTVVLDTGLLKLIFSTV